MYEMRAEISERHVPGAGRDRVRVWRFFAAEGVLFGEALPDEALEQAQQWPKRADLFIVLGSSLAVSPANRFPQQAKSHGARLVIVNYDSTPLDDLADLVIRENSIGEMLASC